MWVRKKAEQWHQCQAVLGPGVRGLWCLEGICLDLVFCSCPNLLPPICLLSYFCPWRAKGWNSYWYFPSTPNGSLTFVWNPHAVVYRLFYSLEFIYLNPSVQSDGVLCLSLSQFALILEHLSQWLCMIGSVSCCGNVCLCPLLPFPLLVLLQALWLLSR